MTARPHVLFSVLNWGLGHAARSIPIIKLFQNKGFDITVASDGRALNLLQMELTNVSFISLCSYGVSYPFKSMLLNIALQWPRILFAIIKEHIQIKHFLSHHKVEYVISDNRYGCFKHGYSNIFISHQINPPTTNILLDRLARSISNWFLSNYQQVWIPDDQDYGPLNGKLVQNPPSQAKFIGLLSRFSASDHEKEKTQDLLVILSGPEPQRSIFEKAILDQLLPTDLSYTIVRGKTEMTSPDDTLLSSNGRVLNFLDTTSLRSEIIRSRLVISRSGYSSIMDYLILGVPALIIPTPGQYEQEYLSVQLKANSQFIVQDQTNMDIPTAFEQILQKTALPYHSDQLNQAIDSLIEYQ
jgi:predicted glycosyltransferase